MCTLFLWKVVGVKPIDKETAKNTLDIVVLNISPPPLTTKLIDAFE